MKSKEQLAVEIKNYDGKGYGFYKNIKGSYKFAEFILSFDHIQGDPYASPSRIRVIVNQNKAKFPSELFNEAYKKIALVNFVAKVFNDNINKNLLNRSGSGKSGMLTIDKGSQQLLDRTAIYVDENNIEARLEVGLPANGRRISGRSFIKIFFEMLPIIVRNSLYYNNIDQNKLIKQVKLSEDQSYLRSQLKNLGLISFVANGSILPRGSGVSSKPLKNNVLPFESPKSLEIEINLPNKGIIKGMGIKKGITLIVGGGYHGKSTLLNAIELGVYNHIEGDGREYVITLDDAVKIRAEDGRRVEKVNVTPFINNLPNNKDTKNFSTENASGSTSQAANIIESIEIGTSLLLIDEDTSATNFMIRDERMQRLVSGDKEPITPFINRVKSIYEQFDLSTILVIGGSGDYFDVADTVIMLDEYKLIDVTNKAKNIAKEIKSNVLNKSDQFNMNCYNRKISKSTFAHDSGKSKVKTFGLNQIGYDKTNIDLNYVEQLVDESQTRTIAIIIEYIKDKEVFNKSLKETVDLICEVINNKGLESISKFKGHPGNLAMPRKYEIAAALNRFRRLKIK